MSSILPQEVVGVLCDASRAHAKTRALKPRSAAVVAGGTEPVCSMRVAQASTQRASFSPLKVLLRPSASSANTSWARNNSAADCQAVGSVVVLDILRRGAGC